MDHKKLPQEWLKEPGWLLEELWSIGSCLIAGLGLIMWLGTPTLINTTSVQPLERRLTQFQLPIKMLLLHPTRNFQDTPANYCVIPCLHSDYYNSPASQSGGSFSTARTFNVFKPHSIFGDGTEECFAFHVPK
ncbi:hypothetical protein TNCV_2516451 [Trichonephila clavipes]|nr:hypothetical protein TNCV_2516451 [Trichonephila clavipes]